MMSKAVDLARASFKAYERSDRAALEAIIANDFHFTSPVDDHIDRKTYFERCWPNNETIALFDFINVVDAGDKAIVTYEGHGKDKIFRNTEVFTVRAGKIVEVEVYFGWSIPKASPAKRALRH